MNFARLIQVSVQPRTSNGLAQQLPYHRPIQPADEDSSIQGNFSNPQRTPDAYGLQPQRGYDQQDLQMGVTYNSLDYLANADKRAQQQKDYFKNYLSKSLMDEVPSGNQAEARKKLGLDTWQQRFKPDAPLDKNFVPNKQGSTVFFGDIPTLGEVIRGAAGNAEHKVARAVSKKIAHPVMNFLKHLF